MLVFLRRLPRLLLTIPPPFFPASGLSFLWRKSQIFDGRFVNVIACNVGWASDEFLVAPYASLHDGAFDIVILDGGVTSTKCVALPSGSWQRCDLDVLAPCSCRV